MESRASYFLVGLFVLALMTATFVASLWLARTQDADTSRSYLMLVRGAVTGLQVGSPVRLRGVPVGTVADIALDPQNIELIRVRLSIRSGTPIKVNTIATLGVQGITGQSFVQLSGGTQDAAEREAEGDQPLPVIPYRPGALERIAEDAPELIMEVQNVAVRINQVLSDENVRRLGATFANLERLTGSLGGVVEEANGSLANIRRAADDAAALARDLRGAVQRLTARNGVLAGAERGMTDLSAALQSLERVGAQLDVVVAENRRALRDFANYSLQEFAQLMVEARGAMQSLSRLTAQIERDPARFLFGDQQRGFQPR